MDDLIYNFIQRATGLDPATLALLLGVLVAVCNLLGKLIPDSATGPLGILRKVCKVLGLYVTNRITPLVSTGDVARSIAASVPDAVIQDAANNLPLAVKTGTSVGEVGAALAFSGVPVPKRGSGGPFASAKTKVSSPAFVGILAILFMLFLSGCSTLSALSNIPASPSAVCDKSLLDEQAGTGVELGYKAWRVGMELAVDSGKLHGAAATRIAKIDNQLYAGTVAVQTAYSTCNAASYRQAIKNAQATLAAATLALKGN